jgi:hypothetical protein
MKKRISSHGDEGMNGASVTSTLELNRLSEQCGFWPKSRSLDVAVQESLQSLQQYFIALEVLIL